jgi:hypothetical protein
MERRDILFVLAALMLVCISPSLVACGWIPIGVQSWATCPATTPLVPTEAALPPAGTATGSAPAPTPMPAASTPPATTPAAPSRAGERETYASDTPTPMPDPSPTSWLPTAAPEPAPRRILFAEDATSATVIDTLQPGETDRYILRALAGQILSVDIAASHPILLNVRGVDGTVPKADVDRTAHWQGTLPSTQDYFVELVSSGPAIDYQMDVTIPELVEPAPTQGIYRSAEYGFEVQYPADLVVEQTCAPAALLSDPIVTFRLAWDHYYAGTNLVQACVAIGASRSEEARSMCTAPRVPHEQDLGEQEINSIVFHKSSRVGVATGNVGEVTWYRTLYDGTCYEIGLFLYFHDVGVVEPGTVSEFDRAEVTSRLEQVLRGFRLAR